MSDNASLKVRLLGAMSIERGEEDLSHFPSRKAQTLFSFLALHRHKRHSRDVLTGTFWPGRSTTQARKRLRTELWQIRKFLAVESGNCSLISSADGFIRLSPKAKIWVDVVELERRLGPFENLNSSPSLEVCEKLHSALDLYRGDLLEGHYDEWCLEVREHLRTRFLTAVERLMKNYRQNQRWDLAIDCGRKILRHEPLTESVHRSLMRCYFVQGDRAAALRQFEKCTELLAAELDVAPMYETREVFEEIKSHQGPLSIYQANMASLIGARLKSEGERSWP